MKKSFFALCTLLLLALGGLGWTHHTVADSARRMVFREERLTGDLSAADGVSLNLRAELDRHLFWDADIVPGQAGQAEFRFTPKRVPLPQGRTSGWLEVYSRTSVSASTSGSFDDDFDEYFLPDVLQKLADQTAPSETKELTIPLADYADYYPLAIELFTPAVSMIMDHPGDSSSAPAFLVQLADAFRFPVLEGHQQTFSVTRNASGALDQLSYSAAEDTGADIYSHSFYSDQFVYFVPEARTSADGHLLDYSGTPNGYGIYALPMDKKKLTLEDLQFVYPLDEAVSPQNMTYNQEKAELLYTTDFNDIQLLHRVDATTWQEKQVLPICKASETDDGIWMLIPNGDLLLAFQGEQDAHLLQQDESGAYVYRFPLRFPEEFAWNLTSSQLDYFYDGDRLVLLTPIRSADTGVPFAYYYNTSYALYVFGAEGTRYAGYFASALDAGRDNTDSSRYSCRLSDEDALALIPPEGGDPDA